MDKQKQAIALTQELLASDFSGVMGRNEAEIKSALTEALVQLLLHDLEKLWNILYRIDVNEHEVKALFAGSDAAVIAPGLANLIYKRVEQKALTRLQYRS
jgi:hypothetical protein